MLLAGEGRRGWAAAAAAAAEVPPFPTMAGADAVRATCRADPGCLPRSLHSLGCCLFFFTAAPAGGAEAWRVLLSGRSKEAPAARPVRPGRTIGCEGQEQREICAKKLTKHSLVACPLLSLHLLVAPQVGLICRAGRQHRLVRLRRDLGHAQQALKHETWPQGRHTQCKECRLRAGQRQGCWRCTAGKQPRN